MPNNIVIFNMKNRYIEMIKVKMEEMSMQYAVKYIGLQHWPIPIKK